MKRFFILLWGFGLTIQLWAPPASNDAVISTNTVSTTTGIYFESGTVTLTDIQAGTTPVDFTIDLFSWTSRNRALDILFQTTPALSDGLGHTIPLVYSFTSMATGTTTSILDNTWINVIPNGNPSFRDGITSPGFITISFAPIPGDQAEGSYTTGAIPVDVRFNNTGPTVAGFLTLNATVVEFIVIGFADTSADTSGIKFVGADIDFGTLTPGVAVTPITQDVYVHTNRNSDIQITFADTPALLSTVDGVTTLPVTYTYSLNAVSDTVTPGVPFVAFSGANDGTTSVGTITFAPDTPDTSHVAGSYAATVNVVVSAM